MIPKCCTDVPSNVSASVSIIINFRTQNHLQSYEMGLGRRFFVCIYITDQRGGFFWSRTDILKEIGRLS